MKLSREAWLELEPLLSAALDMEPPARAAWLETVDRSHPALAPTLRRMLQRHERAERSHELETVPRLAAAPAWRSGHVAGERIGPFELVRALGHGGMGEVWLARQVDGRVEREVALKLPGEGFEAAHWRERFRRERDFLSRLEHPHIARLYDAGVTESGRPWLAMEYVEGLSLSAWLDARPHSIAEKLALFRQVLAAVAHAHRHLVVHRDLKPANIMVDALGQVKLLDFGIAKLVDERQEAQDAGDLTRMGGRVMTLRYAAPEQAAAGAITTATDIYALGVILHEALAGVSPYRAVREGRRFTDAMLLQEPVGLASRLATARSYARLLAGDLDAILLKALRRDPGERYGSAELFDEDVRAFLERRPVKARAGTWRYLAGRFAARNKLPLAAAAAVVATLLAGLVMVERERRIAIAEKARAERHFAGVRGLANAFVFDVHSEIEHLPGALKARQTLVATALKYLDSLVLESRDDPQLALEVATAYRKLAEIEGDAKGAHLGNPAGALRNVERAAALLESLETLQPDNIAALREHRVLALFHGRLRLYAGDVEGVNETAKAAAIAERITRLPGATVEDRRNLGATLAEYGGILAVVRDDHAAAAIQVARAVEQLEAVVRDNPGDIAARADLAYAYERSAIAAEVTGDRAQLPRAIQMSERSIAATLATMQSGGVQSRYATSLVKRYNNSALMKLRAGDIDGARDATDRELALLEQLAAGDPRNVGNATMRVSAYATAAEVEHRAGRHARAIELAREAIASDARLSPETRRGLIEREQVVGAKRTFGASACTPTSVFTDGGALAREGRALLAESLAFKRELVERGIDVRDAQAAIIDIDAALARCTQALAAMPR